MEIIQIRHKKMYLKNEFLTGRDIKDIHID